MTPKLPLDVMARRQAMAAPQQRLALALLQVNALSDGLDEGCSAGKREAEAEHQAAGRKRTAPSLSVVAAKRRGNTARLEQVVRPLLGRMTDRQIVAYLGRKSPPLRTSRSTIAKFRKAAEAQPEPK